MIWGIYFQNGFKPRIYEEENMKDYVRYSIATEEQLEQLEALLKNGERYDLSKIRNTNETQLNIELANNGQPSHIDTGVGFLDHMLTLYVSQWFNSKYCSER